MHSAAGAACYAHAFPLRPQICNKPLALLKSYMHLKK